MNKFLKMVVIAFVAASLPVLALADDKDLAYKGITQLETLTGTSAASGDFIPVYDASALKVKKVDLGANLAVLAGVTASAAELNYNDITTLGTGAASKAVVLDASGDYTFPATATIVMPSSGSMTFASGSTLAIATTAAHTGAITGDGGDSLYGFKQDQVATTTTSVTLAQCGKSFVSDSADVMTLPEASTVLGCRYTFIAGTADDLDINPADGTDQIGIVTSDGAAITPSAGDAIRITDVGAAVTLEAIGANLWAVIAFNGAVTDVN